MKNVGIIYGEAALTIYITLKTIQNKKIQNIKSGFNNFVLKLTQLKKTRCNFVDDMGFGTFVAKGNDISGQRALSRGSIL